MMNAKNLLLIVIILFPFACFSQAKIAINDIKKINLIDNSGGLGFLRLTNFEIVPENDAWHCYQVKQLYSVRYDKKNADYYKQETSDARKFVKNIEKRTIDSLLETISIIKPKFDWKSLKITPKLMVDGIDSNSKKKLTPDLLQIVANELSKEKNIRNAIDFLVFRDFWTDDYPTCAIEIITKNNDTAKIITRHQMDFMLPWTINNVVSFDLNINNFFTTTMGDYKYSNKSRLQGARMCFEISQYIERNYTEPAFTIYNWKKSNPVLFEKITKNFEIAHREYYDNILLRNKKFPENFFISANIKTNDSLAVENVIQFKDTVLRITESNNFVFRHYKNDQQYYILFQFKGQAPAKYNGYDTRQGNYYKNWLNLPANEKYINSQVFIFDVMKGNRSIEKWLVFPDNLVLISRDYPVIAGLSDERLAIKPANGRDCLIVFDNNGKIISVYK